MGKKLLKMFENSGKNYNYRLSDYTMNASPICISDNMTGKMLHIPAISTSNLLNSHCRIYKNIPGSICERCFADITLRRFSGTKDNTEINFELLTTSVLDLKLLPVFDPFLTDIVRLEAFGDVENETHIENYINIARLNPEITFTLWTKNPQFIKAVCDRIGKPENMIFIQSSIMINQIAKPHNKYIDKIFTVFTKEYIEENNIQINCGSRDCFHCRKCYKKTNEVEYIYEVLK